MLKRLAIGAGAVGLLLGAAAPAFATVIWNNNWAVVKTGAIAGANTGGNTQNNTAVVGDVEDNDGNRSQTTGNASATADATSLVNKNLNVVVDPCGCEDGDDDHMLVVNHNVAAVGTTAVAGAGTGANQQNDYATGGGDVEDNDGNRSQHTGAATVWVSAASWVNINRNLVGFVFP